MGIPQGRTSTIMRETAELSNAIWLPHVILPTQLSVSRISPELELMRAVLLDALDCIRRGDRALAGHKGLTGPSVQDAAITWMQSTRCSYLYDFEYICEVLCLDASAVRAAVLPVRNGV
jgi:hypothetical protein